MDQVRPGNRTSGIVTTQRRLADLSSSNPIRWRPCADPGQKPDPGGRTTYKGIDQSRPVTEDGVSGVYVKGLFQRLGIADEMKSKTLHGRGAEMVAEGKAELGITQISEILPVAGADVAGPLPREVQQVTAFPAAVGTAAKELGAARALLKYLATPEAAAVMKSKGLEPPA
jgi:molybdate transport system substrate-binding protein